MSRTAEVFHEIAQARKAARATTPAYAPALVSGQAGGAITARMVDADALAIHRTPAADRAPWFGTVAIATGLLAVPLLISLAGWNSALQQAAWTQDIPSSQSAPLEQARLRLNPI